MITVKIMGRLLLSYPQHSSHDHVKRSWRGSPKAIIGRKAPHNPSLDVWPSLPAAGAAPELLSPLGFLGHSGHLRRPRARPPGQYHPGTATRARPPGHGHPGSTTRAVPPGRYHPSHCRLGRGRATAASGNQASVNGWAIGRRRSRPGSSRENHRRPNGQCSQPVLGTTPHQPSILPGAPAGAPSSRRTPRPGLPECSPAGCYR